jgi:hypothetical protein
MGSMIVKGMNRVRVGAIKGKPKAKAKSKAGVRLFQSSAKSEPVTMGD